MPLLDKLCEQYRVGAVCSELHIAPSTYSTVSNSDIILINVVPVYSAYHEPV
ncbi:hypothetical protein F9437_22030 [Escherichia coli]|nr:hypothetical protein [Escherichia coli]EFH3859986.1 hypothetical protein [Escherichia coli]EFH3874705.1 hypothetical protein [Escherichia coli]EFH5123466.1 hypothetical protein [Escherichia coli]EFH8050824.1 hypothetical protein [Escherichia coli]